MVNQNYRHWVIWRCPSIRFLDYQKVKDVERTKAEELFGTASAPSALASKVCDTYFCRLAYLAYKLPPSFMHD